MAKKTIKIYLEPEDERKLREKAEALNFKGRGAISHYIEKIAKEPIVFLDKNTKEILKCFALK